MTLSFKLSNKKVNKTAIKLNTKVEQRDSSYDIQEVMWTSSESSISVVCPLGNAQIGGFEQVFVHNVKICIVFCKTFLTLQTSIGFAVFGVFSKSYLQQIAAL